MFLFAVRTQDLLNAKDRIGVLHQRFHSQCVFFFLSFLPISPPRTFGHLFYVMLCFLIGWTVYTGGYNHHWDPKKQNTTQAQHGAAQLYRVFVCFCSVCWSLFFFGRTTTPKKKTLLQNRDKFHKSVQSTILLQLQTYL